MNLPAGIVNRIILVRHGEPEEKTRGMCYGKLNVGLSDNGKRQVAETAVWLRNNFEIAAVYSSPRTRATESAKATAVKFDLPIICENSFAEMDFGDFEGMTYDAVKQEYPEIYRIWMTRPTEVEFPSGESFVSMRKRVLEGIEVLRKRHLSQTIAVFSHGGVNRIALTNYLGIPNENLFRFEQNYGCANVIDFYENYAVTRIVNHSFGDFA